MAVANGVMAPRPSVASKASVFQTFKGAAWLGWQIESNWAEPWVFAVYSVIRPLAGVGIVTFMYLAVSAATGTYTPERLAFVYVGTAFFMFVGQELFGISQAVLDDREHYRTLKYVYIAPGSIYVYLFARGLAKVAETAISCVVTLSVGALVLHINFAAFDPVLLVVSLVLGILGIATFGIMLAGITLLTARHGFQMGESVAAIFFVLGGVVFPISILPGWAQNIAYAVPVTYWIEAMRRSLIGDAGQANSYLASMPTWQLLITMVALTVLFFALSVLIFKQFDRSARRKGRIDITTNF
jgi:ABC-2 type transport system permease protein